MARPILKSIMTVSGLTMISRLTGFARQMLLAGVIGASGNPVADAFWAAFRLPNMFRRLLAEGAFQAAFVPLFQGEAAKAGEAAAREFAEGVLAWLLVVLTVLSSLVMIFTPAFVGLVAGGFTDDPDRFGLTTLYTRIMFPYLACMSLVGLLGGMLNALHRFAVAAAAPVLLNVAMIAGVLAFSRAEIEVAGMAAAWSVMVGGLLQLVALGIGAARSKLLLRLRRPRVTPALRRMLVLGLPGFIGAGALQINAIIGTNVASRQDGAVSWLIYADQLYQLPLAIIGIALGVVLMPAISRSIKSGDEAGARTTLNRGLEVALFFGLPAGAALAALANLLCAALYQDIAGEATKAIGAGGSAFNDIDVANTGAALALFGLGLPAFVLQKVFAAAFFAREDTRTPMTFAFVSIAVNATLSIALFPVLGFLAVPLATIIASWTEVTCLCVRLVQRKFFEPNGELLSRTARLLAITAGLAALLNLVNNNADALSALTFGRVSILVILVVPAGIALYVGAAFAVGAIRLADLKAAR